MATLVDSYHLHGSLTTNTKKAASRQLGCSVLKDAEDRKAYPVCATHDRSIVFFRDRKNGHFILAVESGRHTDPASGNSYRTFAIWKPEAARSTYTRDSELSEKYKAVTPEKARVWWTEKHATVTAIETIETHIIGGAIIPLWQRLKTHEDTRLRVVRVSTDDAHRIVGIQIPQDRVGVVLRTIGSERDLREPDEIFNGILDEGEEITLVSNLKLRRGLIHREPAIELCGADPYKFAELRELGLIKKQISWKQRFFIPTDETTGIEILSALLDRYPVVVAEEEANETDANLAEIVTGRQMNPTNVVDLDQWIVSVGKANPEQQPACEIDRQVDAAEPGAATEEEPPFALTQEAAVSWTHFRQSEQTQLAFSFG